jgi:hypothetical protein
VCCVLWVLGARRVRRRSRSRAPREIFSARGAQRRSSAVRSPFSLFLLVLVRIFSLLVLLINLRVSFRPDCRSPFRIPIPTGTRDAFRVRIPCGLSSISPRRAGCVLCDRGWWVAGVVWRRARRPQGRPGFSICRLRFQLPAYGTRGTPMSVDVCELPDCELHAGHHTCHRPHAWPNAPPAASRLGGSCCVGGPMCATDIRFSSSSQRGPLAPAIAKAALAASIAPSSPCRAAA